MRMSKDDSKTPSAAGPPAAAPEAERIARRLSRAGVASRREAERMIEDRRVRVNGKIIDSPALNVTLRDLVEVDGVPLSAPERPRLWRYHKPAGLVTTERDEEGRQTVFESLPSDLPRVMSVGRLDLTSEGLLLLTNDGALKRRLELPSTGWLRKYRVRVHGRPSEDDLRPLSQGMIVDGERFQPMTFSIDRQQGANAWLTVALREGRNREIRRALGALGFDVGRLIRVSYGPFQLNELKAGEVDEIRAKVLRDQLGLEAWEDEEGPAMRGRAPAGDAGVSLRRGAKSAPAPTGGAKRGAEGADQRPASARPMRRGNAAPGMAGRGDGPSGKESRFQRPAGAGRSGEGAGARSGAGAGAKAGAPKPAAARGWADAAPASKGGAGRGFAAPGPGAGRRGPGSAAPGGRPAPSGPRSGPGGAPKGPPRGAPKGGPKRRG
ncbi:MAG: 23S rRNA pseudouridine2605 synthase [Paracoccaceae bacterium]|jgi:23S rRNA pseudouridine2605 synthase